jgi:uncharacterized protein YukE
MADIDSTPIQADPELKDKAHALTTLANECIDTLDGLQRKLRPLAEAWTHSQAASYYQGLQQEWNIAVEGLMGPDGVLGQIAHALHISYENYAEAEWANIGTWRH